jgi:hypothetical protein
LSRRFHCRPRRAAAAPPSRRCLCGALIVAAAPLNSCLRLDPPNGAIGCVASNTRTPGPRAQIRWTMRRPSAAFLRGQSTGISRPSAALADTAMRGFVFPIDRRSNESVRSSSAADVLGFLPYRRPCQS